MAKMKRLTILSLSMICRKWNSYHKESYKLMQTKHFTKFNFMIIFLKINNWGIEGHGLPRWLSGKESPISAGNVSSVPGSEISPAGGNVNLFQYSCLRIPWTEEPGDLQSTELQRVGHIWATNTFTFSISTSSLAPHPTEYPIQLFFYMLPLPDRKSY